jgi:hypothetical protein
VSKPRRSLISSKLAVALALYGASLFASSCATPTPLKEAPEKSVARARAVLEPFKVKLKETLGAALARGPEAAIDVCAVDAPRLAAEASRDGVRVGRAAARLRSPANAAPSWAEAPMTELARTPREGEHRVVSLEGGRVGYVETITTKPMCLGCHGSEIRPEVATRIASRYPNDHARGFADGDFRGIFWAELPSAAVSK